MHCGDALWRLYGSIALLEQLCPTDARVSCVAAELRHCAGIVGAHISVPEPSAVDLDKILTVLRGELPADAPTANAPATQQKTDRAKFADPEIIEAARAFVGVMVNSQLFEWADMVGDINDKLQADGPFFTFKQARALINIAKRGEFEDGTAFMDQMENDYPEATMAVKNWAEQA